MKIHIFTYSLPQHESARAAALRQRGASSPGWVLRGLIHFKPPFYPKTPFFSSKPFLPSHPVILQPRQQLGFGQVMPPCSSLCAGKGQGRMVALPPSCPVGRFSLHEGSPPIAGSPLAGGQTLLWPRGSGWCCAPTCPLWGCNVSNPKEKKINIWIFFNDSCSLVTVKTGRVGTLGPLTPPNPLLSPSSCIPHPPGMASPCASSWELL